MCSRVDVVTLRDQMWELQVSLAVFSQWRQGIRQRRRTRALLCTFMDWDNGKGVFFRVENFFKFLCEWIISARASCTRKLLCLFCREKLCYKKTQTWVVGQKHKRFREFWTPFPLRDIRKNPRSMYARMPQAMAQFVLKVEKLSHIMVPTPVLEMARAYAPDYGSWSGIISLSANRRFYFRGVGLTTEGALTWGFTTEQQVYK